MSAAWYGGTWTTVQIIRVQSSNPRRSNVEGVSFQKTQGTLLYMAEGLVAISKRQKFGGVMYISISYIRQGGTPRTGDWKKKAASHSFISLAI